MVLRVGSRDVRGKFLDQSGGIAGFLGKEAGEEGLGFGGMAGVGGIVGLEDFAASTFSGVAV